MELRQYLHIVRKRIGVIVLGTVLAGAVAFAVSSQLPPTYSASTSLLVRSGIEGNEYAAMLADQHLAATYRELLTKRPLVEAAGRNLDLPLSAMAEFTSGVSVWVVPDTSVIRLAVATSDPRLAMELANEIVAVFLRAPGDTGAGQGDHIQVLEAATLPAGPESPRILFNTLVAAIGGCALAAGAALLMWYLDDTLGTAEEISHSLSLPTLAKIPRPTRLRKQQEPASALAEPTSSLAEAYRALSARLWFSSEHVGPEANGMPNTLLVTSPLSRGEKSNLAGNLGAAMAGAGLQVLLVDADVQQPTLHELFGATNKTGLTNLLTGTADCEECVSNTDIPSLSLISAGPAAETSGLSWTRLAHLVEDVRERADVVLFDAPPVLAAADTMVLASQVEATILAVNSGHTRREVALQAVERLRSMRASLIGAVLNGV
ncbi:MAG: hypothetical protein AMJ93_10115 [Anaerolineae bacterium SM23_84]|nr:MAG: hypothetical protein AMJ93_10115 [Anaerolineae bacterium SM23_84]